MDCRAAESLVATDLRPATFLVPSLFFSQRRLFAVKTTTYHIDLTKKLKKNRKNMKIISRSATPFSSIISVFLLTVICQNEASKLKRLDQAVSKAHFEFSLDLYKTLGKILQFIFKSQKKIYKSFMYNSIIFTFKRFAITPFLFMNIHTLKSILY